MLKGDPYADAVIWRHSTSTIFWIPSDAWLTWKNETTAIEYLRPTPNRCDEFRWYCNFWESLILLIRFNRINEAFKHKYSLLQANGISLTYFRIQTKVKMSRKLMKNYLTQTFFSWSSSCKHSTRQNKTLPFVRLLSYQTCHRQLVLWRLQTVGSIGLFG